MPAKVKGFVSKEVLGEFHLQEIAQLSAADRAPKEVPRPLPPVPYLRGDRREVGMGPESHFK